MKYFDWNVEKNELLKRERDIGFEEMVVAIDEGRLLALYEHPNKKLYAGQRIFVIEFLDYVYLVPFVEDDEKIFLKTIIPSRKATKEYLINPKDKKP